MANNLDLALQRILSVEWKINDDAVASHLKLLREHFRRMVLWAKKLDCLDTWPYFSFTTYLDPTIQVDEAKKQAVRQHLKNVGIDSHLMIADLKYSLDWAAVLDMVDSNITSSLPDPYEPLLIFYERGGIYYKLTLRSKGNRLELTQGIESRM